MPKLTKTVVDALPIPTDQPSVTWDDRLAGFGVKVLPTGARKYVLKYRTLGGRAGRQRWLALGAHGAVTCEQARQAAQQALASIAGGADPQAQRTAHAIAPKLADVWARFERDYLSSLKSSTQRSYKAIWQDHLKPAFGRNMVRDITRSDVDAFHKKLSATPYQANRILALLSRLMNLAEAWEWRDQGKNPCRFIAKFKERERQRFLTNVEIVTVKSAIRGLVEKKELTAHAAAMFNLLLLTGARSGEITSAEWSWVDWQRQIIALPDSKTGAKPIYLGNEAIKLLAEQQGRSSTGQYIFPGRSPGKHIHNLLKPWQRVCEEAGVGPVRVHDLRHTAASVALAAGASLSLVGRLLGHTQTQTTLRYSHLDFEPALEVANIIGGVVSPKAALVDLVAASELEPEVGEGDK